MKTYVEPIIQDYKTDVVILHIGCNDISNKNMSAKDIAEGLFILRQTSRSIMLICYYIFIDMQVSETFTSQSGCSEHNVNE